MNPERNKIMVTNEIDLYQLLSSHNITFYIPPYQRNYEWDTEQCQIFYTDILKTYNNNMDSNKAKGSYGPVEMKHFFGSVTYYATGNSNIQTQELVLIDGQQRITTTLLFLMALRDISTDENLKEIINDEYLKNRRIDNPNNKYRIKLKQIETDGKVYEHLILGIPVSDKEKQTAIYKNYNYFYEKLKEFQNKGNKPESLFNKGLKDFTVITIELKPYHNIWEKPQEIFESMNSLGKPLSLADLVRNYLLLGLDSSTQERLYKEYWIHIEETLPNLVSDYIRDFMQWKKAAIYEKSTEANYKKLYRSFKEAFAGISTESILKEMSQSAELYAAIVPGGHTGHKEIDKELKDLQYLKITTAYSFLMALLDEWKKGKFTDTDIQDIFDIFRIYITRRRLIGLVQAENKIFPLYVNYLNKLESAKNKKDEMLKILIHQENKMRLPNDIEIAFFLDNANFYNIKYCEYILSLIEQKLTKKRPTDDKVQIEHIMPQTLTETWKKELGPNYQDIHEKYVNNIGNLTLIRHNQEVSNKPFEEKKKIYENNEGIRIARKEITNYDKWDENAIKQRSKWIINYLLTEVLPIPENMRRTNNFNMKINDFSFIALQLVGETINFINNPSWQAKVISDTEVKFEGEKWKLSPLTRELYTRMAKRSKSGAYRGSDHWEYNGIKLTKINNYK